MELISVHPVDDHTWPRVKSILVNSLQDLNLYKLLSQETDKRHRFMNDYIENEYQVSKKTGKSFFWYCRIDQIEPNSSENKNKIFMAAKLILPDGVFLNKSAITLLDINSFVGAKNTLRFDKDVQTTLAFPNHIDIASKYPHIFKKLSTFRHWQQERGMEIAKQIGLMHWEGCNIAIASEFRKMGIAVKGIKKAMSTFIYLADAANCHLILANTGVPACRYVCKHAGFQEVFQYWYANHERWLMLADIREVQETSLPKMIDLVETTLIANKNI